MAKIIPDNALKSSSELFKFFMDFQQENAEKNIQFTVKKGVSGVFRGKWHLALTANTPEDKEKIKESKRLVQKLLSDLGITRAMEYILRKTEKATGSRVASEFDWSPTAWMEQSKKISKSAAESAARTAKIVYKPNSSEPANLYPIFVLVKNAKETQERIVENPSEAYGIVPGPAPKTSHPFKESVPFQAKRILTGSRHTDLQLAPSIHKLVAVNDETAQNAIMQATETTWQSDFRQLLIEQSIGSQSRHREIVQACNALPSATESCTFHKKIGRLIHEKVGGLLFYSTNRANSNKEGFDRGHLTLDILDKAAENKCSVILNIDSEPYKPDSKFLSCSNVTSLSGKTVLRKTANHRVTVNADQQALCRLDSYELNNHNNETKGLLVIDLKVCANVTGHNIPQTYADITIKLLNGFLHDAHTSNVNLMVIHKRGMTTANVLSRMMASVESTFGHPQKFDSPCKFTVGIMVTLCGALGRHAFCTPNGAQKLLSQIESEWSEHRKKASLPDIPEDGPLKLPENPPKPLARVLEDSNSSEDQPENGGYVYDYPTGGGYSVYDIPPTHTEESLLRYREGHQFANKNFTGPSESSDAIYEIMMPLSKPSKHTSSTTESSSEKDTATASFGDYVPMHRMLDENNAPKSEDSAVKVEGSNEEIDEDITEDYKEATSEIRDNETASPEKKALPIVAPKPLLYGDTTLARLHGHQDRLLHLRGNRKYDSMYQQLPPRLRVANEEGDENGVTPPIGLANLDDITSNMDFVNQELAKYIENNDWYTARVLLGQAGASEQGRHNINRQSVDKPVKYKMQVPAGHFGQARLPAYTFLNIGTTGDAEALAGMWKGIRDDITDDNKLVVSTTIDENAAQFKSHIAMFPRSSDQYAKYDKTQVRRLEGSAKMVENDRFLHQSQYEVREAYKANKKAQPFTLLTSDTEKASPQHLHLINKQFSAQTKELEQKLGRAVDPRIIWISQACTKPTQYIAMEIIKDMIQQELPTLRSYQNAQEQQKRVEAIVVLASSAVLQTFGISAIPKKTAWQDLVNFAKDELKRNMTIAPATATDHTLETPKPIPAIRQKTSAAAASHQHGYDNHQQGLDGHLTTSQKHKLENTRLPQREQDPGMQLPQLEAIQPTYPAPIQPLLPEASSMELLEKEQDPGMQLPQLEAIQPTYRAPIQPSLPNPMQKLPWENYNLPETHEITADFLERTRVNEGTHVEGEPEERPEIENDYPISSDVEVPSGISEGYVTHWPQYDLSSDDLGLDKDMHRKLLDLQATKTDNDIDSILPSATAKPTANSGGSSPTSETSSVNLPLGNYPVHETESTAENQKQYMNHLFPTGTSLIQIQLLIPDMILLIERYHKQLQHNFSTGAEAMHVHTNGRLNSSTSYKELYENIQSMLAGERTNIFDGLIKPSATTKSTPLSEAMPTSTKAASMLEMSPTYSAEPPLESCHAGSSVYKLKNRNYQQFILELDDYLKVSMVSEDYGIIDRNGRFHTNMNLTELNQIAIAHGFRTFN